MTVSNYYTPSGRSIQKAYDSTSVVDTNIVFKTVSGRPVHAGGGIVPDIIIKDDIAWDNPSQKEWMDIISEYAIRHNLSHHGGKLVPIEQVNAVMQQLPDDMTIRQDLTALAMKRGKPGDTVLEQYFNDNPEDILRIARATLVAYRTGEEGWYVGFNTTDPMVRKAVEMVRLNLLLALKSN
jgi:carboxyl-terminal processing protease